MGELSYKLLSINDFEEEKNNERLLLRAHVVVKGVWLFHDVVLLRTTETRNEMLGT